MSGAGRLGQVAKLVRARTRGDGSWYAADCPRCGTNRSLSLTVRGFECRWDGCRWSTTDVRKVLALTIAAANQTHTDVNMALRFVAA